MGANHKKCLFDPADGVMDALLPEFGPKLKAVKLMHLPEDTGVSSRSGPSKPLLRSEPSFKLAVSARHDSLWTEKKEAELQRALKKWYTIVFNWPDSWACKRELQSCRTIAEGLDML